jgi:hypothetical protein
MKFKVGDKVKVKGLTSMSDPAKKEFVGQEFTIKEFSMWANWPYVLSGNASNFNWSDNELELIFTKSDLKDGMVVEYRHGWMELVLGEKTVDDRGSHSLCNFDDELINKDSRESDIMRVYTVNGDITGIGCIFDRACLTLIWERKEEPKHKEMTVEEIEKELGYKIKVVGDASCQK